jgi:hypothetical protein
MRETRVLNGMSESASHVCSISMPEMCVCVCVRVCVSVYSYEVLYEGSGSGGRMRRLAEAREVRVLRDQLRT